MKLSQPIPILRIFDEAVAKEFYVGFLGFKVDWEHRFADGCPGAGMRDLTITDPFGNRITFFEAPKTVPGTDS